MEVLLDTFGRRMVQTALLIYLFVLAAAAADCPPPQTKGNIVLNNEALLMNDFPDGTKVTYECTNGYEREDGSGTITCIDGTWTESDLKCKKKDCGLPRDQPHMRFEFTEEGTLFGASVKTICDKGYYLSGAAYKQCFAGGWSGRSKCEVITCDKPIEVTNGRSSWESKNDPAYGEVIQYFCNEGYILTGNDTVVCNEHGVYNSQPPECKGGKIMSTTVKNSISTEPSTPTPITHRGKIITTNATSAVSPSARGGRDILTTEDKITTTNVTGVAPPPVRGKRDDVDTKKDFEYLPVIIGVISTSIVILILVFIIHKLLLKRKGSYDTGEDLKPELLQFQNI
ncbi:hypothetical protein LDENG_00076280 [Lucifuga dentata]|nr:hypothetical protein LDENG_00076280 [Lucifuga dentata]